MLVQRQPSHQDQGLGNTFGVKFGNSQPASQTTSAQLTAGMRYDASAMVGKSDTANGVFRIEMGYMSGSTFVGVFGLARGSWYYEPVGETTGNLK